ncbi:MAG: STAS domain-containing protein [Sporomusaceae bacterium]|nr:STAS domain-containing protein [Sporomusaceae bacterium]
MSLWMKTNEKEVYMNINGEVCLEHIEFLQNKLMDRLQYGYRRIVLDVTDVKRFDHAGIPMLKAIAEQMLKRGGELIIKDKNDVVGQFV